MKDRIATYMLVLSTPLLATSASAIQPAGQIETDQSCRRVDPDSARPGFDMVKIDDAWSGVRVRYPAIARNGKIYFAYYDATRQLAVAEYAPAQHKLCVNRIPSRFGGWDSHNGIFMAFDPQGFLHVAANMHASPLVYARGSRADSAQGIALSPMVGTDEARVTYPRFYRDAGGNMLFAYRSGGSGNGAWVVNGLQNGRWARLNRGPILAARDRNGPVSAYPSDFVQDDKGIFHMAIVWRRTPDTATNFRVSYISTPDFRTWRQASGRAVTAPISPDNADTVDDVGVDHGLGTSAELSLDRSGTPVIAYTKYDDSGANAVYLARPGAGQWTIARLASGKTTVAVKGRGTRQRADVTSIADFDARTGNVAVTFPQSKAQSMGFDPASLRTGGQRLNAAAARPEGGSIPGILTPPKGLLRASLRKVAVLDATTDRPTGAVVQYFAQDANRDRAPACTAQSPQACKPPASPIYLVTPSR